MLGQAGCVLRENPQVSIPVGEEHTEIPINNSGAGVPGEVVDGREMQRRVCLCLRCVQVWNAVLVLEWEQQISLFPDVGLEQSRNVTTVSSCGCCPTAWTRSVPALTPGSGETSRFFCTQTMASALPSKRMSRCRSVCCGTSPPRDYWEGLCLEGTGSGHGFRRAEDPAQIEAPSAAAGSRSRRLFCRGCRTGQWEALP